MRIERILEPSDIKRLSTDPAFQNIGKYVENTVVDILGPFVPPAYLYRNPILWDDTRNGEELTDVLFWYESTALLIECKGRKIRNLEDLRNHNKLHRWLSKTLSDGRTQLMKAEAYLKKYKSVVGKQGNFAVIAELSSVECVIPIIIVFEISDFFWQPRIYERKKKYPQIQLFDLRGFYLTASFLPHVHDFFNYFRQKQSLSEIHPDFISYEENLLIFYLSNGKSLEKLLNSRTKKDLNLQFAKGSPQKIRPSDLYDTSPQNVETMLARFRRISDIKVRRSKG